MVPLKYCKLKVAKEIAEAVDNVLRKETGKKIPDRAAEVTGIIVIRFRKDGASVTVMGDLSTLQALDILDQTAANLIKDATKGESIAVS